MLDASRPCAKQRDAPPPDAAGPDARWLEGKPRCGCRNLPPPPPGGSRRHAFDALVGPGAAVTVTASGQPARVVALPGIPARIEVSNYEPVALVFLEDVPASKMLSRAELDRYIAPRR